MAAILGVQLNGQAAVLTVHVNPAGLLEVRMGNNPLALLPIDVARYNLAGNILTVALLPADVAHPELFFQIRDQDGVSAPPTRLQIANPIGGGGGPHVINMAPHGAPPNIVLLGQGGGQAGDPQAYQLAQMALNQLGGVANAALQHGHGGQAQAVAGNAGNPADPQAFLGIVGNLLTTMRNEAAHWINLVGQQLGGHGQGADAAPVGNAGQNNVVVPIAPPRASFTTTNERNLVIVVCICLALISGLGVWLWARNSEPTTPPPPVATATGTTGTATVEEDNRPHCAIVQVTGACAEDLASAQCVADLGNCQ